MLLDNAMIYRRTDSGVHEVYEKSHQFTQSERLILILLDGRLDVAGVKSRLPSMSDERLARALRKLLASGLIEPVPEDSTANGDGSGALQPDAIAQFLEQTELDPVTVIASADTAEELDAARRASPAAAPNRGEILVRPATPVGAQPPAAGAFQQAAAKTESVRSQSTNFQETFWDPARATDFAITTVNVPDRLDVQEVRARAADDDARTSRRWLPDAYTFGVWLKRGLLMAVLAALGYWGYLALPGLAAEFSPARIEERLSAAVGAPAAVGNTHWRLTPSPRFVLEGLVLPGGTTVKEAYLTPGWRRPSGPAGEGRLVWAEIMIPELDLSPEQAFALLPLVAGIGDQLPWAISSLRIGSLRVTGSTVLPGRYEATARRGDGGRFAQLELRDPETKGSMLLTLSPSDGESGNAGANFRLEAARWRAPIGPAVEWIDVVADGWAEPRLLLIKSFVASGFYGAIQGAAAAAGDVEWVTTASIRGSNLDLEAVQQSLRAAGAPDPEAGAQAVMQGTASMELVGSGRGATMQDAVAASELQGPVQVRWGVLNGINLGYAATHGASTGGSTRFSELEGRLVASQGGMTLRDIVGRAGAMSTSGQFSVAPDLALSGSLRVELGITRIHAPLNLRVSGTATAPQFGG